MMDNMKGGFIEGDNLEDVLETARREHPLMHETMARRAEENKGVFSVGEKLEIKGSRFRIKSIGRKFMHLELLPII